MGCIVSKLFWIFIFFLYLQGPLASVPPYNQDSISCTLRPSSREGGGNSIQLSTREALNVQPLALIPRGAVTLYPYNALLTA